MPSIAKKKRPGFSTNVVVGGAGLDAAGLRHAAESNPETYQRRIQDLIDDADNPLRMQDVTDLRKLFLSLADVQVPARVPIFGETRSIMSSAWPLLVGGMVVAGIEDTYQALPTIGQELVTDFRDNKKISIMAKTLTHDNDVDRVDEGVDFPEIGASVEKFEIGHHRNGRMLKITAEAVEENDVPNIVEKINKLATIASDRVEEQTLRRVCDIDGSGTSPAEPYVMHRNGAAAILYSNSANTPDVQAPNGTRLHNNILADDTNLEAARVILASMTNERGKRINIPMSQCILLVPDALAGVAAQWMNSEYVPAEVSTVNNWGPRGAYRPRLLSSPKMDDLSTTTWYLGNFAVQFKRKWKLSFEYVTLTGNTQEFLNSRLAFQARIAWDCEIGVTDFVHVVQSLSGTTAP